MSQDNWLSSNKSMHPMGSSSSSSSLMQLCVCLKVNYRGSTGFGKSFLHAGDAEWGVGAMQNDLTDSVEWAVQQGIADPKRVAIFGGSYGQSSVMPLC